MQRYLARRLLLFFPTLVLASLAIFAIMRVIPGDVAQVITGGEEGTSVLMAGQLESIRQELGLTESLPVQYGRWVWSLVNGEFGGRSLLDKEDLSAIIGRRLPVTLQLAVYTLLISWTVSLPLGIVAAIYQNRWPDYIVRTASIAGHALPNFWIALVLILGLVLLFRWTPPIYYVNAWEEPWQHLQKLAWPSLILSWGFSSSLVRVTRSNMLEVFRQDYIRTARSKGLTEQIVVLRHVLRNALIPVVTLAGLQIDGLLSGSVILENLFGVPGIGQGIVHAATERDYPVIQSLTMLLVLLTLGLNLLVDFVYSFVDPRIKYA